LLSLSSELSIGVPDAGLKARSPEQLQKFLSIPPSFLAQLAGLMDGDGYIPVTKTTKGYIEISLVIGLDVRDIELLKTLQATLGLGRVTDPVKNKDGTTIVKWIINRTDLQEVLFPLFIYHSIFFLTNVRREQFNLALYVMDNGLTKYAEIPESVPTSSLLQPLPLTPSDYLLLPFFNPWVVGFTMAEGSFLVKSNQDACFQIKQRSHIELFKAFQLLFNTNREIGIEFNQYMMFSVSSKKDIQTVINFFSHGPVPLMGSKQTQYLAWIQYLKNSVRYSQLQF